MTGAQISDIVIVILTKVVVSVVFDCNLHSRNY